MKAKPWIAVYLRAVLLACCWIGVHKAVLPPGGGFLSSGKLLYFTYQSNLWALAITAVYFALGVMRLINGTVRIPRALQIARYAVAVSITITFLVFWGLLSPAFLPADLLTLNNQTLHTAVPVLFVSDFLLFDRGAPIGRRSALWAAAPPLYYLIFSLLHAALRPDYVFKTGGRYPYFFLDLDRYGWFGSPAGLGVAWWTLLLTLGTLSLGMLYRYLHRQTLRASAKERTTAL